MDRCKRARLDRNEEGHSSSNLDTIVQSDDVLHCQNENCTKLRELAGYHTGVLNVHRWMFNSEEESVLTRQNIDVGVLKKLWTKRCTRACAWESLNQFVHACATYPSPETFHQVVAFLKDDESLADLMKEKGVDGATPLHVSVQHMEVKEKTIEVLKTKVGINDVDDKGDNVLSYAVQGGRDEAYLKLLLGLGAEPRSSNDGASLALQAVKVGNVDGIKLFGPMMNEDDFYPETAEESWLQKVFCEYGANLSSQAIHETVKALLDVNKALVLLHDEEGRVPLWFAKNGPFKDKVSAETVELLMSCGREEHSKLKRNLRESQAHLTQEQGTQCAASTEAVNLERVIKREVSSDEEDMSNAGQESGASFECNDDNSDTNADADGEGDSDVSSKGEDGDKSEEPPLSLQACSQSNEDSPPECQRQPRGRGSLRRRKSKKVAGNSDVSSKGEDEDKSEEPPSSSQACSQPNQEPPPECQPRKKISLRKRKSTKVAGDSDVSSDPEDENAEWKCDEESDVCSVCNGDESENDGLQEPASTPPACARCSSKPPPKCPPRRSSRTPKVKCKGLTDDEKVHKIFSILTSSTRCKKDELREKKTELKQILQTNPDLVNRGLKDDPPLLYNLVHVDLLKFLIQEGADVSAASKRGKETVLHRAAASRPLDANGYHQLVEAVKRKNPSVLKMKDAEGRTPIHVAVKLMDLKDETVGVFETLGDLNDEAENGWNALMFAVAGGRSLQFVKMLEGKGVLVKPAKDGTTVVHIAAGTGRKEVFDYFLQKSETPVELAKMKNYKEKTPLHFAVEGVNGDGTRLVIVKDLMDKYGGKAILFLTHIFLLVKLCVENTLSKRRKEKEIQERVEMMKLLFGCVPYYICEDIVMNRKYFSDVHPDIMKELRAFVLP